MLELLSKAEVCKLLRISSRTLDRWRSLWKAKGIDVGEVKIRRKALFKRERIEKIATTPKLWLTDAPPEHRWTPN